MIVRPNTTDSAVYNQVWKELQYDIRLPFVPQHILDLGAYTGISALWFLQQYSPPPHVYCVEPSHGNYNTLVTNISQYPSIVPLHGAVWSSYQPLQVIEDRGEWGHEVMPVSNPSRPVQGYTLGDLYVIFNMRPDLIKMDVEGAELYVMRNNRFPEYLEGVKAFYVECHNQAATAAFHERFENNDWTISHHHENHVAIRRSL